MASFALNLTNSISSRTPVILITGALGFIGSYVVKEANSLNYDVYGLGHGSLTPDKYLEFGFLDFLDADVSLESLLSLNIIPDVIVHCASSASVSYSLSNPGRDFSRTVESTLSVLEFIRLHSNATRLVLPSSAAVYGLSSDLPLSINTPLNPVSPYGFHKKFAEELCIYYGILYGVQSTIVRLFSVYGIGLRKQLLWDACNKLSSGRNLFDGTGLETRDWLHVTDAAKLLLLSANYASSSSVIVNGGTSHSTSIRCLVSSIANKIVGSSDPLFTGICRDGDPNHLIADLSSLSHWCWSPRYDLETGISDYVDWFLDLNR